VILVKLKCFEFHTEGQISKSAKSCKKIAKCGSSTRLDYVKNSNLSEHNINLA